MSRHTEMHGRKDADGEKPRGMDRERDLGRPRENSHTRTVHRARECSSERDAGQGDPDREI